MPKRAATTLAHKILMRATQDKLKKDHELRLAAEDFDKEAQVFYSNSPDRNVKKFLCAWSKARKLWKAYTGEELD